MSVLREVFSRVLALGRLTLGEIVREMNEVLRRTEEARIYHGMANTGEYPPRRTVLGDPLDSVAGMEDPCGPPGVSRVA